MISKAKLKWIKSLSLKKKRDETGLFVAEGSKTVFELQKRFECCCLFVTEEWADSHTLDGMEQAEVVTKDELEKASLLKTPHDALAVFRKERASDVPAYEDILRQTLCLGLDNIQDPGNLGTIIRIADWFGIDHIFCSPHTVDAYSPKTVQATMGALARVHVHTVVLDELLKICRDDIPVYGTFLDGDNIYTQELSETGLILMGNEGNGISDNLKQMVTRRLFIPSFPPERLTSESLNVATATAVVCAEFRRRKSC